MAWEARIAGLVRQEGEYVYVPVAYYDTATPDQTLYQQELRLQSDATRRQIKEAIVTIGVRERARQLRAAAFNEALAGVTVPIPEPGRISTD